MIADEIPPWMEQVESQFSAIGSLSSDWDSNGATAPDHDTLESAFIFLAMLSSGSSAFPAPHINPTRDGGVQFEWEAGSRYFEIEVVGLCEAKYYFEDSSTGESEEGRISEGDAPASFFRYIQRVTED